MADEEVKPKKATGRSEPPQPTRGVLGNLIVALIALIGVTAFGLVLAALNAPAEFWLLVSLASGAIIAWLTLGSDHIQRLIQSSRRTASALAGAAVLVFVVLVVVSARKWPVAVVQPATSQTTAVSPPASIAPVPTKQVTADPGHSRPPTAAPATPREEEGPRAKEPPTPKQVAAPQVPLKQAEARKPGETSSPGPPEQAASPPVAEQPCEPAAPDRPARVELYPGDLVVAAARGVFRLNERGEQRWIAEGEYLSEGVRGVAVDDKRQTYVTTRACGRGAVVKIDPATGVQTPLPTKFGTPKGIAVERGGNLLVGDENPSGAGNWGELVRVYPGSGEKRVLHTFRGDETATGITIDRSHSNRLYFASRDIYRFEFSGPPRRISLTNLPVLQALAYRPRLLSNELHLSQNEALVVADYQTGFIGAVDLDSDGSVNGKVKILGEVKGVSSVAVLARRDVIVAGGIGNNGEVAVIKTPMIVTKLWSGRSGSQGVFVAVVD